MRLVNVHPYSPSAHYVNPDHVAQVRKVPNQPRAQVVMGDGSVIEVDSSVQLVVDALTGSA